MAFGMNTFNAAGGAVADLFAAEGYKAKAEGNRLEAKSYDLAAKYALQNKQFTETSTEIKQYQLQRDQYRQAGQMTADIAGNNLAMSGSALDILRDAASQGALTQAVAGQQGLIDEAGYQQQADSYKLSAEASRVAAEANETAATGAQITGAIKGVAAVASFFV